MKRRLSIAVALAVALGAVAAFASTAVASPNLGMCSSCHSLSSSVVVKATQTSNNGTTASYNVSVSGPRASFGWAVYDGSTRLKYAAGSSGSFSVTTGKTYTVFGGNADGSAQLYNKITVSPIASTPPTTPPSTPPSGTPSATGTPDPGTTVTPEPKIHWSVHFNLHHRHYKGLKAVLKSTSGAKYYSAINRRGNAVFNVPAGAYRLSTTGNKHYKFKTKRVMIGVHESEDD